MLSGFVSEQAAEQRRQLHPCRLRFSTFSDKNPWMRPVAQMADEVQRCRRRADEKSPFVTIEKALSEQIVASLNAYRDMRDLMTEQVFMAMYGSPLVQACVGLQKSAAAREGSLRDLSREWARQTAVAELQTKLDEGGLVEACVRSLLYIGRGREIPGTDERVLTVMREIRAELPASRRLGLEAFKNVVRRQNQTLQLYEDKAVAAIPSLLAGVGAKERSAAIPVIRRIAAAGGELSGEAAKRLTRIETLFAGKSRKPRPRTAQRINGRRRTSRTEVARRH
jgi:hypothetical protein